MIARIIYALGGFIMILIGLRFVLRLLGANPASGFVEWVYDWSTPFVAPFANVFGQEADVTGGGIVTVSVFDWAALIALAVIGIFLALIGRVAARARA